MDVADTLNTYIYTYTHARKHHTNGGAITSSSTCPAKVINTYIYLCIYTYTYPCQSSVRANAMTSSSTCAAEVLNDEYSVSICSHVNRKRFDQSPAHNTIVRMNYCTCEIV